LQKVDNKQNGERRKTGYKHTVLNNTVH